VDADADLASCVTVTERTPDEIFVRASVYAGDLPGITVVEGETLCIAARVGPENELQDLHLANVETGEPALFRLRLDPSGSGPRFQLEAAHSLSPYRFVFGRQSGPGPTFARVGPAFLARWAEANIPDPSVHEVLVTDLVSVRRVLRTVVDHFPWSPPRPRSFAYRKYGGEVVLFSGIARFPHLDRVSDALVASGHEPFPTVVPNLGFVLDLALRRWRLRLVWDWSWMNASSRTSAANVHARLVSIGLDAGYEFLRWRGLTGFVLAGVGGSGFTMNALGPGWNYLGSRTAELGNPGSITRDTGLLSLSAGFEQYLPWRNNDLPLVVSLQCGYSQAFATGSWFTLDNNNQHDVPDPTGMDVSGSWVRVGFGFAVPQY
jgi:hypothetical protein